MSDSSSDSVDLSLSFSVLPSKVKSTKYQRWKVILKWLNRTSLSPKLVIIHQQGQMQRQEMTTLETKKGSTAETGRNMNVWHFNKLY
jgi:hypothetical protein